MATTSGAANEATEGPVFSLINKRLRALRKKHNRILQMEESLSQGKTLNKEQEDVLRSKPAVVAAIDELEKLRQPLSSALSLEISQHLNSNSVTSNDNANAVNSSSVENEESVSEREFNFNDDVAEELLNLVYFGSLFDVKSQSEFGSIMLTRAHERECCLTYDYVTDDDDDLLVEKDLDSISLLGRLMISRPVDSSLSHKNALEKCAEHAKLWLANSDQAIDSNSNVTYKELRMRLKKIMASDYFTITPELKALTEVAAVAAAAAGKFESFQVPIDELTIPLPLEGEGFVSENRPMDENRVNVGDHKTSDYQPTPADELQKDDSESEKSTEEIPEQQEHVKVVEGAETIQREEEPKVHERNHQNQRVGSGDRRSYSYSNGRGGRNGGKGGGHYQNGHALLHDRPGNHYQRNYSNNQGRGSRVGGHPYN